MKRFSLLIYAALAMVLLPAYASAAGKVKLEKPTMKQKDANSFAIVIDNTTYSKVLPYVLEYRDAVQEDGLATYILRGDWPTPESLRSELKKLDRKARRLEGIVLIGDIPVAMVRNAQHNTTAFKMDEVAFDRNESSVASDRFYDDLDLEFEYIDRDSVDTDFFYYKLKEDGPQYVSPDFYSGRIKYPRELGGDKYEAIAAYLQKAVEAKRNPQDLDNIVTFAGNGYNSDCLVTWMDEDITLKENFPGIKDDSGHLSQLNFRMDKFMKYRLFDQLQRPEVDAMFFNEHGSIDKQHISGEPLPTNMDEYLEEYKWGYGMVYDAVSRYAKTMEPGAAKAKFAAQCHLTDKFFEDYDDPAVKERRSSISKRTREEMIISLDDLKGFNPQPRFVMFNACYNGSFHRPGSISGYYIFAPEGRTVACQGNTVNVLQDRWTYEDVGLLSAGCRVGEYNRRVATLEGHIIGDPTFHFNAPEDCNFRGETVRHEGDTEFWRGCLSSPYAAVQSCALAELVSAGAMDAAAVLDFMKKCPFGTVRMECLKLLSLMGGKSFTEAIILGLDDDYELVRRNAASLAGRCGDPATAEALMYVYLMRPEELRVAYSIGSSMQIMDASALRAAVDKVAPSMTYLDNEARIKAAKNSIAGMQEDGERLAAVICDKTAKFATRKSYMRRVRNANYHSYIPEFISVVADPETDTELRVIMAEALGWFRYSYRKAEICDGLKPLLSEPALPAELRAEITQTLIRLQ